MCKTKVKNFWLNLNAYTNLAGRSPHQRNNVKRIYSETVKPLICALESVSPPISIKYTIYLKTKARADLMNYGAIVDKFFSDAMVECGYLPDDSVKEIVNVSFEFGGYDKANPRADVEIKEINGLR